MFQEEWLILPREVRASGSKSVKGRNSRIEKPVVITNTQEPSSPSIWKSPFWHLASPAPQTQSCRHWFAPRVTKKNPPLEPLPMMNYLTVYQRNTNVEAWQKFPGQGWNPHHSSDNARWLTCWATSELWGVLITVFPCHCKNMDSRKHATFVISSLLLQKSPMIQVQI